MMGYALFSLRENSDRGLVTRHHVTVTYRGRARRHKTYYLVALLVHPFGSMSRIKPRAFITFHYRIDLYPFMQLSHLSTLFYAKPEFIPKPEFLPSSTLTTHIPKHLPTDCRPTVVLCSNMKYFHEFSQISNTKYYLLTSHRISPHSCTRTCCQFQCEIIHQIT